MKRTLLLGGTLALAAAVVFAGAGVAYAASGAAGRGPGGQGPGPGSGEGILAEYMDTVHEKMASALGISESELEAAREEGQTLSDLSETYGVELEQLWQIKLDSREDALDQAVADGVINQEQAQWMLEHQNRMGTGQGECDGTGPTGHGPFGRGGIGRFGGRAASGDL